MEKDVNITENKTEKAPASEPEKKKSKRIRNELLFKKGGVSLAITALFVAGVIVFNVLFGILSDRLVLEYDFSKDKVNTLSKENVEYIKKLNKPVKIILCSAAESYASERASFAEGLGFIGNYDEYFAQTVKLVKKYAAYNKKIELEFVDTYSTEYQALTEKYYSEIYSIYSEGNLCELIVESSATGTERHKIISFADLYEMKQDVSGFVITGNNTENAIAGAISYCVNKIDKKIGIITGHSSRDYTSGYRKMLKENNYEITDISEAQIKSIPKDLDQIVIPIADRDFSEDEIIAISEYLENDGKYGKGLIVYTDAAVDYNSLSSLYGFIGQWGITVEDGILYSILDDEYIIGDRTTLLTIDDVNNPTMGCLSRSNAAILAGTGTGTYEVTVNFSSAGSAVAVEKDKDPKDVNVGDYEPKEYVTAITSEKGPKVVSLTDEDVGKSRVSVFSSRDFLDPDSYSETVNYSNKDVSLEFAERNIGSVKSDITFVSKNITDNTFAIPTEAEGKRILRWFVFIIPIIVVASGIFVYIRRRNAK